MTLLDWRPSALVAACPQVIAVATGIRHAGLPVYGGAVRMANNSIGALVVEGTALSGIGTLAALMGGQRADADVAKGFNARGNRPRGRRRV